MPAARAESCRRAGRFFLSRKITGMEKVRPSSATSGGGTGMESADAIIAMAARSNAASPELCSTRDDTTWPKRFKVKPTTI